MAAIARARTSTDDVAAMARTIAEPIDELTLQAKLAPDGAWHRKAIGGLTTGCGTALPSSGWMSRDESYLGLLCKLGCFSAHEISRGASDEIAERERKADDIRDPWGNRRDR